MFSPRFNINFDCPQTYKDLSDGLTEGIFQLTSQLGHSFTKKLRPENIGHLAALGSILRPGCLDSKLEDGHSLTTHYVKRKNLEEDVPEFHPVVDKILKDTYGIMCYQEQSMELSVKCAGFNLQEADILRRGIGHKEPETIAKCKKLFLEKASKYGVIDEERGLVVINQIEASQRYQFAKPHAVCYGITGYNCAYIKTHFPINFYKSWLKCEKDRTEYRKLVNEAKLFNITVNPPDIRHLKMEFYTIGSSIYFGLYNIKGIKRADVDNLATLFTEKEIDPAQLGATVPWIQFLVEILENLSSNTTEGLIYSGSCDCFKLDREAMWSEYTKWRSLTDKEKSAYTQRVKSLKDVLSSIIEMESTDYEMAMLAYKEKIEKRAARAPRKKEPKPFAVPKRGKSLEKAEGLLSLLENPVYNIIDTIDSVVYHEEDLLGVALTRHPAGSIKNCVETHSCLQIAEGCREYAVLQVKLDRVSPYRCKNGQSAGEKMAFLEISDKSYKLGNVVAFPNVYKEFQYLLTQDNLVFLSGSLQKDSFCVQKVYPIS
jgi:DNA polymerase III alpha subunit